MNIYFLYSGKFLLDCNGNRVQISIPNTDLSIPNTDPTHYLCNKLAVWSYFCRFLKTPLAVRDTPTGIILEERRHGYTIEHVLDLRRG